MKQQKRPVDWEAADIVVRLLDRHLGMFMCHTGRKGRAVLANGNIGFELAQENNLNESEWSREWGRNNGWRVPDIARKG